MLNNNYLPVEDEIVQLKSYVPKAKRSAYKELMKREPGSLSQLIEVLLDNHFADQLKVTVDKFLPSASLITDESHI